MELVFSHFIDIVSETDFLVPWEPFEQYPNNFALRCNKSTRTAYNVNRKIDVGFSPHGIPFQLIKQRLNDVNWICTVPESTQKHIPWKKSNWMINTTNLFFIYHNFHFPNSPSVGIRSFPLDRSQGRPQRCPQQRRPRGRFGVPDHRWGMSRCDTIRWRWWEMTCGDSELLSPESCRSEWSDVNIKKNAGKREVRFFLNFRYKGDIIRFAQRQETRLKKIIGHPMKVRGGPITYFVSKLSQLKYFPGFFSPAPMALPAPILRSCFTPRVVPVGSPAPWDPAPRTPPVVRSIHTTARIL